MEITSFYPMIATSDLEETQAVFEALGFKKAHVLPDLLGNDPNRNHFIMKNEDGYRICIYTDSSIPEGQSCTSIWMNVRDFEGARSLFREHGYTEITQVFELKYLKCVSLQAPSGFVISVFYHIREHD